MKLGYMVIPLIVSVLLGELNSIDSSSDKEVSAAETESAVDSDIDPIILNRKDFDLFDKEAIYTYYSEGNVSDGNDLIYRYYNGDTYILDTFLGSGWTIDEVLQVYNINSASDITSISAWEGKNSGQPDMVVDNQEKISEFYDMLSNCTVYSNIEYTASEVDMSEIDLLMESYYLMLDINTIDGYTWRLRFEPYRDLLRNDTFFQLSDGEGYRLFECFNGFSIEAYLNSQDNIEP